MADAIRNRLVPASSDVLPAVPPVRYEDGETPAERAARCAGFEEASQRAAIAQHEREQKLREWLATEDGQRALFDPSVFK